MIVHFLYAAACLASLALGRVLDRPPLYNVSQQSPGGTSRLIDAPAFSLPETGGIDFDPKKYADEELWKKYVAKGEHLICLMQATDQGTGFLTQDTRTPPSAASRWTGDMENELARWFWHEGSLDYDWECDFERQGLKAAFEGQGLNAKPAFTDEGLPVDGHNDCVSIEHYDEDDVDERTLMKPVTQQKYNVNGRQYMATGAHYQFALNKIDGAIIGKNLDSPATSVLHQFMWYRSAAPGELPDLRQCSDIYWALWVRENPNVKNLRVYGAHHVINDNTVLLTSRAFKNKGIDKLTVWPGLSFSADTDEGRALIASPIGATIAHVLVGHKAELGIKHVTKVTIVTNEPVRSRFGERPQTDMHIFFTIEDVPADKVTKDDPGEQKPGGGELGSTVLHVRNEGRDVIRIHTMQSQGR